MKATWYNFLPAIVLTLTRISGMAVFSPFFSSNALPIRVKIVFVGSLTYLLTPLVAVLPNAHVEISVAGILAELAVGLTYGLLLTSINEIMLFAGQLAGLQFSFSLVNILDPESSIQTPLFGELFQLMGTLVLITSGLDRILIASVVRSFRLVPLGCYIFTPLSAMSIVKVAAGIFIAAIELAIPLLTITIMVEIVVALISKLSPQLPVMSISVPLKTLAGFALFSASFKLWPRFIETHFENLLNSSERLITHAGVGG